MQISLQEGWVVPSHEISLQLNYLFLQSQNEDYYGAIHQIRICVPILKEEADRICKIMESF